MKTIVAALVAALAIATLSTVGASASELVKKPSNSVLEYCAPTYWGD